MFSSLQLVGLIYDAVGAAIIGLPAFRRMAKEVAALSGTHWDANPHAVRLLSEARVDTVTGLVLLLLGFCLQAVPLVWVALETPLLVKLAAIALVLFVTLYCVCLRGLWSRGLAARAECILNGNSG